MPYDALCTVNQVKSWLKVSSGGDDGGLAPMIMAASESIGRHCNRPNLGNVYSYDENYSKKGSYRLDTGRAFSLTLRKYPIVSITNVIMESTTIPQLTNAQVQLGQSGFYIQEDDEEPRILKFIGYVPRWPINVIYTAGYLPNAIPFPLQQAAIQHAAELYRGEQWVDKKSVTIGTGETTSIDQGDSWGMGNRTRKLLEPFRDVVPFRFG